MAVVAVIDPIIRSEILTDFSKAVLESTGISNAKEFLLHSLSTKLETFMSCRILRVEEKRDFLMYRPEEYYLLSDGLLRRYTVPRLNSLEEPADYSPYKILSIKRGDYVYIDTGSLAQARLFYATGSGPIKRSMEIPPL